jgi:hypothetical protein
MTVVSFYLSFSEAVEFSSRVVTPFVFLHSTTQWAPFVFWATVGHVMQHRLCHEILGKGNPELCAFGASGVVPVSLTGYVRPRMAWVGHQGDELSSA